MVRRVKRGRGFGVDPLSSSVGPSSHQESAKGRITNTECPLVELNTGISFGDGNVIQHMGVMVGNDIQQMGVTVAML